MLQTRRRSGKEALRVRLEVSHDLTRRIEVIEHQLEANSVAMSAAGVCMPFPQWTIDGNGNRRVGR
jgi:hypothetical protein